MIKPTAILLLLLLPLLSPAQQRDSFRKTDVVKSRFNIEGIITFPVLKTDLSFTPVYQKNIAMDGSLRKSHASYGIGFSQDFRLKDKYWLHVGFGYHVYKNPHIQRGGLARLVIPALITRDIKISKHPFFFSFGPQFFIIPERSLEGSKLEERDFVPGEYHIFDNEYYHNKTGLEVKLVIGKLFSIDDEMDLRFEGFTSYSISNTLLNPDKGKLYTLGIKVGLTTFFHKWEKVE